MLSKSDIDKRQFIKKYGFILNQYRSNLPGYTSVSTATALFILQAILAGYQSWIEKEPDVKSTLLQAVDFSAGTLYVTFVDTGCIVIEIRSSLSRRHLHSGKVIFFEVPNSDRRFDFGGPHFSSEIVAFSDLVICVYLKNLLLFSQHFSTTICGYHNQKNEVD